MRKNVFFWAFMLLIISGYLIVLANPILPWPSWDTRTNSITAPNGAYLNVYVAYNLYRLGNPNWNYRSYHWARASNIGANSVGIEFHHDNDTSPAYYNQTDNQVGGLDENQANGVWEYDADYYTINYVAGDTVQPYTALWSPSAQRWGDRTATAMRPEPYTVPAW